MSEKYLKGPSDKYIRVQDVDGLYLPHAPINRIQQFDELKELSARDNDVLVCAYPKSGLHWIWEIIRMLVFGTTDMIPSLLESNMLELQAKYKLDKKESPRVMSTHLRYWQLPQSFRDQKCKIVYILRDPRAVAVSYFHHIVNLKDSTNLSVDDWKAYLDMFMDGKVMYGSWFDTVRDWEKEILQHKDHPIYVIYYENFKQDILGEIQKLAQFLNADASIDFCTKVGRNTQLQKLKTDKELVKNNIIKIFFKDGTYPMYRKGTVDDWKNAFSVSQNEYFEDEYVRRMTGSSIKLKCML